jgi:hypothetical protein
MGATISLFLEKNVPEAEFNSDGKVLIDCAEALDSIVAKKKLGPAISSFFCDPEAMAEDLPEGAVIQEPWQDPRAALATVSGLITALGATDGEARKAVDGGGEMASLWRTLGIKSGAEGQRADIVVRDLRELERCLKLAADQAARFYLLVC